MRQLLKITATFALALVFSAGMAFGQSNDATVTQEGDNHLADIEQIGGDNTADVLQKNFGASHEANVYQDGDDNTANVLSQGGVGTNEVDVDQVGDENAATVDQYWGSNTGTVDQNGTSNRAFVGHRGAFSSYAEIMQKNGGNNNAEIYSSSDASNPIEDSAARILQDGSSNQGVIRQSSGSLHSAAIEQLGSGNTAQITQSN